MKRIFFVLIVLTLLTGCWDKAEIEDRGFVISIGIDRYTDKPRANNGEAKEAAVSEGETGKRFIITMALPNVSELAEKGRGGEGRAEEGKNSVKVKTVKKSASETITGGMELIDSYTSQKIYYGHTKICVLGADILNDAVLFKETVDALKLNNEISRKIILLATDKTAEEILNANVTGEPLVGMFVSNFYKNNKYSVNGAVRRDLESVSGQLAASGNAVIPKISIEDKEIKLGGLGIIKDYKLAGWLNDSDTRGYLWAAGEKNGGVVTVPFEGGFIPMTVVDKKTRIVFEEKDGGLICGIYVKVKGDIEEYIPPGGEGDLPRLKLGYEAKISGEIEETFDILKKELAVDALNIKEVLRKDYYDLYIKYNDCWEEEFQKMILKTYVSVSLK